MAFKNFQGSYNSADENDQLILRDKLDVAETARSSVCASDFVLGSSSSTEKLTADALPTVEEMDAVKNITAEKNTVFEGKFDIELEKSDQPQRFEKQRVQELKGIAMTVETRTFGSYATPKIKKKGMQSLIVDGHGELMEEPKLKVKREKQNREVLSKVFEETELEYKNLNAEPELTTERTSSATAVTSKREGAQHVCSVLAEHDKEPRSQLDYQSMKFSVSSTFQGEKTEASRAPEWYTAEQSSEKDETIPVAADIIEKLLERIQSTCIEQNVCTEASSSSAELELSEFSPKDVQREPKTGYAADLLAKFETLAERTTEHSLYEAAGGSVETAEMDDEKRLDAKVVEVVDEVLKKFTDTISRSDSTYKTATATSRDSYDTCITSQEDTFETAAGWLSQDSEYTTATSEMESRLSEVSEERRGSATPIAMLSPVQSDRHFTASQDSEQEPGISRQSTYDDSKRSSPDVPDIELVPVADDEDENGLLTSSNGVLLAPAVDPGRPVSPVPPGNNGGVQGIVTLTESCDAKNKDFALDFRDLQPIKGLVGLPATSELGFIVEASADEVLAAETSPWTVIQSETKMRDSVHEKAMDFEQDYFRQYSNVSSGSRADTVFGKMHKEPDSPTTSDAVLECIVKSESGSADSLDKISVKSGSSGKRYSTSRRSSASSRKSLHDEPQTFIERLTPELKMTWTEREIQVESPKQLILPILSQEEFTSYSPGDEQIHSIEAELETVDEEPEEADSLNGKSFSSNEHAADIAVVNKYKAASSDNVSETSLQEFERIERDVLNKGESSLSGSEMELYVVGKLKSTDGSTNSLAEFERLEQEVVAEGSPPDEAMILSDIREESEVEEMSIRDDDEDERDSIPDIKAVPVSEDVQAVTPLASPTDSIERDFEKVAPDVLETSTDSLELIASTQSVTQERYGQRISSEMFLGDYEVVDKLQENLRDSLELLPQERDSVLEGASIQELTSQGTQVLLSNDTVGSDQEYHDEEKDSLAGDMDAVLSDYPTTLTTFETTQTNVDGTMEIISRRVLTRVRDPVISHVQFTGTENEERLRELEQEEEFETMDAEGNVTRTTLYRSATSPVAG